MVGHVRSLNQDVAREFVLDAEVPVQHVGCRLKSPVRGVPGALAKQRKKTPAAACDERHPERERVVDEVDWFDVSIGSIESAVDSRAASKGEPVLSATAVSRGLVITGPIHYSESPAENGLWERAVGKADAGSPVVGVHFIQTAAETFLAGEAQTSGQIRQVGKTRAQLRFEVGDTSGVKLRRKCRISSPERLAVVALRAG